MVRDILTNKWIIGAAFFLLIFAGMCYWYYQHTTAHDRAEAEKAEQLLKQWEADKKAKPPADKEVTKTPSPGEIGEKPGEGKNGVALHPDELTQQNGENPQTSVAETTKQEETTQPDTGVSSYGFGPYPEVPADFPFPVEWEFPGSNANHELMQRVAIKLWTQGIETMGVMMKNGLVYPNYIDTVYVCWGETTDDDGNPLQYMTNLGGYPPACLRIEENNIARLGERGPRTAEDIPSDITVLLYDEAGINPYTFLDLPKPK